MHWSPNRPSKVGPWVAHWIHGSHLATGRLCFISTALLTRPMMTLVGICPWNRISTSAQLASAARVKCQMTTWSTGYLAPKAASTFSRCICLEEDTLTRYLQDGLLVVYMAFRLIAIVHEVKCNSGL